MTEYYWMDDSDYTACGTFKTEAEARECAEDSATGDGNHKRVYTILKVVSKSQSVSLKRKWKAV